MDKLGSMNIAETDEADDGISADSRDSFVGTTPLARMGTLSHDDNPNVAMGRPSFDDAIMTNGDFTSQLIGISPRMHTTDHMRPTSAICMSNGKSVNSIYAMSPCVQQSISNSNLSFDQAETPMPKSDYLNWGSRPVAGKDWGESERCQEKVIRALTVKMEARISCLRNENVHWPSSLIENAPFVHPEISAIRADSTMLGFDNEVESCCSIPDSCADENDEGSDEEFCHDSVPCISALDLNERVRPTKTNKRLEKSLAKRSRISICETAMVSPRPFRLSSIHSKSSFACFESKSRLEVNKLQTLDEAPVRYVISQPVSCPSEIDACNEVCSTHKILLGIFSHLSEYDLLCTASLVSSQWSDAVTDAHASLMLISVGCSPSFVYNDGDNGNRLDEADDDSSSHGGGEMSVAGNHSMERPWSYIVDRFPWGMFLSEGTFKRVYKVWNSLVGAEEAVSVMNVNQIDNVNVVGSELAVSVMLSSMGRRNICPNFVVVRGVFTSQYEPSISHWGSSENKKPFGGQYDVNRKYIKPQEPSSHESGSFQYIRMELCRHGDVEEYMKKQPGSVISPSDGRSLLFQMAFSLHVAGNKFGMKHYDVKLLNFFLDDTNTVPMDDKAHPYTVLRYGLGSHVFNVRMRTASAVLAKLADFGTANVRAESNGQPVMIGNFTTLENTPPDFMILGDAATQGYGHDCFGLGLCMLHLFTGHAPYEEILETVRCPPNLKKKLRSIWESKTSNGYEVIRSVILCEVFEDEEGNIIEGEPDETLYDTLYRFLVLFGVPDEKFQWKEGCKVWRAIDSCLGVEDTVNGSRRSRRNVPNASTRREGPDVAQYKNDCNMFSIFIGENEHIASARKNLERMNGGMDLLLSLLSFDPKRRASPLDVMNSTFMESIREQGGESEISDSDIVYSYMAYSL